MPFVFEQKRPLNRTQEKHPQTSQRTSLQRLSNIPRPVKQLVVETNTGISHASKPTLDRLPLQTPSKDPNRTRAIPQDDNPKPKLPDMDSDSELAILELVPFSRQPMVNFGDVKLGTTKIKYVLLRNSLEIQQQLFVKSFPKPDKGFYMDATEFLIAPNTEICVALAWTPKMVGGLRESITLQDVNRMPKRIVLMGTATRPKPEPSLSKSTRNIPRLFRRSPNKINRQMRQERNKLIFSPRNTQVKPLTKLQSPSPEKRHQLVRKILSQHDGQMAIKVQCYWRMVLAKRQLDRLKRQHRMAIKIQAYYRMVLAKRQLNHLKMQHRMAIKIQCYWRMVLAKRQLNSLKRQHRMATKIQSYYRMVLAKRRLDCLKRQHRMATKVQCYWRMVLAKRQLDHLKRQHRMATKIQCYWRMVLAKRELNRLKMQHRMAIRIQAYYRMVLAKRQLNHLKMQHRMAIKIQCYWRMVLAKRELNRLKMQHRMAIRIQAYYRMVLAKRQLDQLKMHNRMAIKIQAYYRMVVAKRRYIRFRESVVWFQSVSRGNLYRRKLKSSVTALFKIQEATMSQSYR
jgi:hypothetical protein